MVTNADCKICIVFLLSIKTTQNPLALEGKGKGEGERRFWKVKLNRKGLDLGLEDFITEIFNNGIGEQFLTHALYLGFGRVFFHIMKVHL